MPRNPGCEECPVGKGATERCVWGERRWPLEQRPPSQRTTIMIVGEAPGPQEDQAGRPFIGPSGAKLKKALDAIGVTDYYVTNVAKCWPGKGETPSASQVAACKHYLWEEIEHVGPTYILALGNTAWHQFGSGPITEHAGKEIYRGDLGAYVLPALHPAALLRDPSREDGWRLDLGRFARLVAGEITDKPPVEAVVIRTPAQAADLARRIIEDERACSFDFEATPVPWWHRDFRAISVAFSWDGAASYILPLGWPEHVLSPQVIDAFFRVVRAAVTERRRALTTHNDFYDSLVWYRLAGYRPHVTFDTMVGIQLVDENSLKSLKWNGRAHLGWPQWDIEISKQFRDKARSKKWDGTGDRFELLIPLDEVFTYNGYDAAATCLLRPMLLDALMSDPPLLRYAIEIELPKLRAVEKIMQVGVHVDRERLVTRIKEAEASMAEAAAKIPVDNPGSTRQLCTWLYDVLKLPVLKYTKGGKPSTEEEVIKRLATRYPAARDVLPYRKWQKYLGTYLRPQLARLDASFDGREHSEYRSTSAETGRLASPHHTVPRPTENEDGSWDAFIRPIYTAPPGWLFLQGDYAQIEARLAAWSAAGKPRTRDEVRAFGGMVRAWLDGRDVYREQAGAALGKPWYDVTKNERQMMGKVPVLAMLYNITPAGLQTYAWREFEIDWTLKQALHHWQTFHRLWPEFRAWHEREMKFLAMRGYTRSEIGRVRRLYAATVEGYAQHEAFNEGINFPIQSLASDITQQAMLLLDSLTLHPVPEFEPRCVGNHHDALHEEVHDDEYAVTVIDRIGKAMEAAPYALRRLGLQLPHGLIKAELSVGPWGEGVDYEKWRVTRVEAAH